MFRKKVQTIPRLNTSLTDALSNSTKRSVSFPRNPSKTEAARRQRICRQERFPFALLSRPHAHQFSTSPTDELAEAADLKTPDELASQLVFSATVVKTIFSGAGVVSVSAINSTLLR